MTSIYTHYIKRMTRCVYDKDNMSAVGIKNTSGVSECFGALFVAARIIFTPTL